MPHFIVTTGSVSLFAVILALYICLAPTIVALMRAHRRFWIILALNLAVAPVQITLFEYFGVFFHPGMDLAAFAGLALLMLLGPGWLLLLAWALRPSVPKPSLLAWRETKTYDMAAALPLIAWFLDSATAIWPNLKFLFTLTRAGDADTLMKLQLASLLCSALFCLFCIWLLLIRDRPVLRAQGILPRLAAIGGTFLGASMLRLAVPEMTLVRQAIVFLLTTLGSAASLLVLLRLGKSFSIMPEARTLVTDGAYRWMRHPLYAAQIVVVLGLILQYEQPWALALGAAVITCQVIRTLYEERVLVQAFPEYAAYRARTRRFGLI